MENSVEVNYDQHPHFHFRYRKGILILISHETVDLEEIDKIRGELVRLYTNLAISYLIKEDFRKVCSTFKDAIQDCGEHASNDAKLHFM